MESKLSDIFRVKLVAKITVSCSQSYTLVIFLLDSILV